MKKARNDIILVCALLALAAIFALAFVLFSEDGDEVVVFVDGKEQARYPLSSDREVVIGSKDGEYNILVIKDGKASVREASCPDKICVSHREIFREDESIVCLPHKLVVRIEAGK